MDLGMIFTIVFAVLLLAFAAGGFARGLWAEVVTLAGVLFGALLTEQWATAWGTDLSEMFSIDANTARFIVRVLLFLVPTLAIGYAGSLLLPKTIPKPNSRMRLFGALVGLLNGSAIIGTLLRAYQYTFNGREGDSALMTAPLSRFLLEWAGWWVLVVALGGSIVVLLMLILHPGQTRPAPVKPLPPAPANSSTAPGAPTTITPLNKPDPLLGSGSTSSSEPAAPLLRPEPITSSTNTAPPLPRPTPLVVDTRPKPSDATSVVPVNTTSGGTTEPPRSSEGARPVARCRTCGKELLPGAAFCTNCGTPVE